MTNTKSEKRPWLGALLAFFLPGLGHVYLREWLRSLMWFSFVVSAVLLFVPIPDAAMETAQSGGPQAAWTAATEATQDVPFEALLPVWVVRIFSAIDAYWLALQTRNRPEESGEQCPACGRTVDEDLDFCQWCTTPLDGPDGENADGPSESNPITR
ncbi:zinc ribbon domain-containing protein [Halorussus salilacus]|uniref:zinc ribbon domain-containing protein n=1 Tax=Halorussus salilacus TaxID=2953750 RepID=UPI00209E78C2|nr:zinc ribbon domain-containing protein [Halorussus salilacus]USZ69139.1 zinc ribbon domain-containing protein [Halorussus salilacus]